MDERIQSDNLASQELPLASTTHNRSRRPSVLRNAGAVVATAIAMGTGIASIGNGQAEAAGPPPPVASSETNKQLKTVEQLPGYGMKVSPEKTELEKKATVKILVDTGNGFYENCTGTKVAYNGKDYVLSAAHCFDFLTGSGGNIFSNNNGDFAGNILTEEVTAKFAIILPALDTGEGNMRQPSLTKVTGVSVSLEGADIALLSLPEQGDEERAEEFDQLPAIDLTDYANTNQIPGQETGQVGIPEKANLNTITTTGIYLGIINREGANYFITAINAPSIYSDGCYFGASGSGAVLADGTHFGSLSRRASIAELDNSTREHGLVDDKQVINRRDSKIVVELEKSLGVKLPENKNVICYYPAPDMKVLENVARGLGNPRSFKAERDAKAKESQNRELQKQASEKRFQEEQKRLEIIENKMWMQAQSKLDARHKIEAKFFLEYRNGKIPRNISEKIKKIRIDSDNSALRESVVEALLMIGNYNPKLLDLLSNKYKSISFGEIDGATYLHMDTGNGNHLISANVFLNGPITLGGAILKRTLSGQNSRSIHQNYFKRYGVPIIPIVDQPIPDNVSGVR